MSLPMAAHNKNKSVTFLPRCTCPLIDWAFKRRKPFAHYHDGVKLTPCARGASSEKLIVHALQRTYCFQASPPDSRPHPVLLFPPNAAPISAPLVPTLTLTIPVSEPAGPIHFPTCRTSRVQRLLDKPCGTALFHAIASSSSSNSATHNTGTKRSLAHNAVFTASKSESESESSDHLTLDDDSNLDLDLSSLGITAIARPAAFPRGAQHLRLGNNGIERRRRADPRYYYY